MRVNGHQAQVLRPIQALSTHANRGWGCRSGEGVGEKLGRACRYSTPPLSPLTFIFLHILRFGNYRNILAGHGYPRVETFGFVILGVFVEHCETLGMGFWVLGGL